MVISEQKTMEDSISHESQSEPIENTTTLSDLPEREISEFQNGEKVLKKEQQNEISNELPAVVSQLSDNLQHGLNGKLRTTSRIPDKGLEDGYNWRKYGQKLVKGNEFIRSYYRCTHPSCSAKRQVERSQDGRITDTVYIGKHEHAKPGSQASDPNISPLHSAERDVSSLVMEEDKSLDIRGPAPTFDEDKSMASPPLLSGTPKKNVLGGSNSQHVQLKLKRDEINHDGDTPLKKLKRDECDVDETTPMEKPYGEPRFVGDPRVVVQTTSEVDILQDGYRWRKYGQKLVKGNPNPRSYYRCSSSGCPVKKHVERASHDSKVVITTYEGLHDHDMPAARTVTPNRGGAIVNTTTASEEIPGIGLDMVV